MKKILSIFACLAMVFSLSSCDGDTSSIDSTSLPNVTISQSEEISSSSTSSSSDLEAMNSFEFYTVNNPTDVFTLTKGESYEGLVFDDLFYEERTIGEGEYQYDAYTV